MTLTKRKEKRDYIAVNVPRYWEPYLNELLELPEVQKGLKLNHFRTKYSGLGAWIIYQFLIQHTSFRFKHFNTYEDHATIEDKKLRLFVDIYPKENGDLWCEECDSVDCVHVKHALKVPEIMKPLQEKGWQYKEGRK